MPPTVAAVCPHCGWPEHDPDFIREEGVMIAVVMTCRRCGESSMLTWPK
jgi:ribosomal protein L37E